MTDPAPLRLQTGVFALVAAAFANICITQPVRPVILEAFHADMVAVSFTVSAVIPGIAPASLPFGCIADRLSVRPVIFSGNGSQS